MGRCPFCGPVEVVKGRCPWCYVQVPPSWPMTFLIMAGLVGLGWLMVAIGKAMQ